MHYQRPGIVSIILCTAYYSIVTQTQVRGLLYPIHRWGCKVSQQGRRTCSRLKASECQDVHPDSRLQHQSLNYEMVLPIPVAAHPTVMTFTVTGGAQLMGPYKVHWLGTLCFYLLYFREVLMFVVPISVFFFSHMNVSCAAL